MSEAKMVEEQEKKSDEDLEMEEIEMIMMLTTPLSAVTGHSKPPDISDFIFSPEVRHKTTLLGKRQRTDEEIQQRKDDKKIGEIHRNVLTHLKTVRVIQMKMYLSAFPPTETFQANLTRYMEDFKKQINDMPESHPLCASRRYSYINRLDNISLFFPNVVDGLMRQHPHHYSDKTYHRCQLKALERAEDYFNQPHWYTGAFEHTKMGCNPFFFFEAQGNKENM